MKTGEETKKCSECLADIPKEAKKCSHCGSKQKTQYTSKQVWLVVGLTIAIIYIFSSMGSGSSKSTPAVTSYSDGYKLAIIDSQNVQFAQANESEYNRLISSIGQNCTLDSGQKVSDMLVVTQSMIEDDTGEQLKILAIARLAEEVLTKSKEKVRCAEFFAAMSTLIN